MTFNTDRLNRLREDARMMRIYHDDHGIAEVIALCDAFERLQAERYRLKLVLISINAISGHRGSCPHCGNNRNTSYRALEATT